MPKRTLAVITELSSAVVVYLLAEAQRRQGEIVVVTTLDDVINSLRSLGLNPIHIGIDTPFSWEERDQAFAKDCMPGGLNFNLPGTDLAAWKVLALDRFSFWYSGYSLTNQAELLRAIDYDRLLINFTLDNCLPWILADENTIALQVGTLRTREVYDLLPHLRLSELVVSTEKDRDFVMSRGFQGRVTLLPIEPPSKDKKITEDERKSVRVGLGIDMEAKVSLVFYESQTEWAFRRWLQKRIERRDDRTYLILPENSRAHQHLFATCGPILNSLGMHIVDSWVVEPAANEFICFRYRSDIVDHRRISTSIQDIGNRFLSKELR